MHSLSSLQSVCVIYLSETLQEKCPQMRCFQAQFASIDSDGSLIKCELLHYPWYGAPRISFCVLGEGSIDIMSTRTVKLVKAAISKVTL